MNGFPDFIPQLPGAQIATGGLNGESAPFDPQLAAPYRFENVGTRMFPLMADGDKLQGVCDRYFNDVFKDQGLPYSIDPIQSIVLMQVLTYPKMFSSDPQQRKLGFTTQNEFLFAIPVVQWTHIAGIPVLTGLGVFVPYIFVDNDWSMIAGRDVVGFPKCGGEFSLPPQFSTLIPTDIKARVLQKFDVNTEAKLATVLEIQAPGGDASMKALAPGDPHLGPTDLPPRKIWPYGPIEKLYGPGAVGDLRPVSDEVYAALLQSAGVWANNYSIRQDRSGVDAGKADYQSIIECRTELSDFKQLGLYSNTAIKLYRYDSLRIAEQLGLDISNNNVLDPIFQIRFRVDFDIRVLRTLSTRCGSAVNTGQSRSCLQLFGQGVDLTCGTLKRQLIVTRNIARKLADGHCHPKHYSDELESGFANVTAYYARLGEFAVEGVSHLFGR